MSPHISLNREAVALVDDTDYEKVRPFSWFLSGTGYAVGFVPVDGDDGMIEVEGHGLAPDAFGLQVLVGIVADRADYPGRKTPRIRGLVVAQRVLWKCWP
jgi:hypothetical protein